MKKRMLLLLIALCMMLSACGLPLSAQRAAEETAAAQTEATAAPAVQESEAEYLPDFTVETIGGGQFTLSEALQEHELVLINLFATWCPPCRMEFPYLQEAWEQEQERVAVIALSIEPTDTLDALRDYADETGLRFPVGREEGTDLSRFVNVGIPTTILVDKSGKVAAVEVGAKDSTQEFLDLFDSLTGAGYDPALCTYTVTAYGITDTAALAGTVINFCTDTTCTPVVMGEDGVAIFTAPPAKYHVQIVSVPEGYQAADYTDWYTGPYGQTFLVPFAEAEG